MANVDLQSLSADQLRRALMAFFDSIPEDACPDGEKPSVLRIQNTVKRVEGQMDAPSSALIRAFRDAGNDEAKAETFRWMLGAFHEQPAYRELVEQAVASAQQPHMSPIPPEFAYLAIGLLAMAVKYKRTTEVAQEVTTPDGKTTTKVSSEASVDLLSAVKDGLPAIAGFLPKTITHLFAKGAGQ